MKLLSNLSVLQLFFIKTRKKFSNDSCLIIYGYRGGNEKEKTHVKAWVCALVIMLVCAKPTATRAYCEYVPTPQPPAERPAEQQEFRVLRTVKVWATKYFIPQRKDYKTEKDYRKALRMEGGSKTATGEDLSIGHIAANLKRFQIGTTVRIKEASDLIGVIEDTGGNMIRNPNQIDIFTDSKEDAEKWGRRKVTMEILERVKT